MMKDDIFSIFFLILSPCHDVYYIRICVINTNINSHMHGYILKEQLDIKMMSFCILDTM